MTNQSLMSTESNKRSRSNFEGTDPLDRSEKGNQWAKSKYSFGDSFGFTEFIAPPVRGEGEELDGTSQHDKNITGGDTTVTLALVQHALNKTNDDDDEEEDYNEAELQPLFDKIQGVLKPKAQGPPPPRTFRVLIIDDSIVQRKICRVLLAVDGQSTFSSTSAALLAATKAAKPTTTSTAVNATAQPKQPSSTSSSSSAKENDDHLPSLKRPHDTWLVQTAESGEHAFQIIATTTPVTPGQPPFDVIIVDQNMSTSGGAMLGHQVVERIRSMPLFRRTVVVGCSAYADEAGKYLYAAGCDAVWSKPMPTKDLIHQEMLNLIDVRLQRIRWFNASSLISTTEDDDADDAHEEGEGATTTDADATMRRTSTSPSKNKRQAPGPGLEPAPGKEEGEGKTLDGTMRRKKQRT